jgi:hypothetical protein
MIPIERATQEIVSIIAHGIALARNKRYRL